MPTLEQIGRQIALAEDLQSVVRTMKTISAVSVRQHEATADAARGYVETVEAALGVALRGLGAAPPASETTSGILIVIGSDVGLCGAFNQRVVDAALARFEETAGHARRHRVITVGARAGSTWRRAAGAPGATMELPGTIDAARRTVGELLIRIEDWQSRDGEGRVELFHHRPEPQGGSVPARIDLLPLDAATLSRIVGRGWRSRRLPQTGAVPEVLLPHLMREFLFARLHAALIQSRKAEHAARLSAMQVAEKSIADKLEALTAAYRAGRQDAITAELLDLIAGFEAMRGEAGETAGA